MNFYEDTAEKQKTTKLQQLFVYPLIFLQRQLRLINGSDGLKDFL